jgi:hypothetical protein
MKFRMMVAGAVIVQGLAWLGLSAAHANVILTYTGNDFTSFTAPYTATDKVTATITLAIPLGNGVNEHVAPLAFTLNDGVQTITNILPMLGVTFFTFSTDNEGNIFRWQVEVSVVSPPKVIL